MSLRQPRLVPIVPMAPVRPGFMAYGDTMGLLNENFCHRVGINPTLPHATKPLTEEQEEPYQNNPRSMGRLLSLSTDGVCVAVTIKRGFGHYRPQHDASMPVRKRAKWREKERPRLGTNNAEAPPAPDPDAHLMGFDPGARSIGGYYIRHPDGTTSSGVLPKCGYTKTPSFGFDMTAASFKSTRLVSINNSIRQLYLCWTTRTTFSRLECVSLSAECALRTTSFARSTSPAAANSWLGSSVGVATIPSPPPFA
ncbi:hypothetical protein J8273_8790 [Carpediemonas membranifera]|uniref:Uncharacterized protein n=1 Tax=Carpediemonas membranifera TaxID=201153 RepID=A0A8J6DYL4_9EUKA|nr:hypothetical protein J8273_8790 [Carpediemonas membranifera]|eukprot:KAG9389498.1 hypothetical protein J8273_8790 [Carpediemonas membranifera]